MVEHTPTPWMWAWRDDDLAPASILARVDGSGLAIAMCPRYQTAEQWVEDAKLIVLAVNSHKALVEALKAVVDQVNDYERVNNLAPNPGRTECWDSVARAKKLLEKL